MEDRLALWVEVESAFVEPLPSGWEVAWPEGDAGQSLT
jgi:hypothetical protein